MSGCSMTEVKTSPLSSNDELGIYLVPTPYPAALPNRPVSPEEIWAKALEYKKQLESCNLDKVDAYDLYKAQLQLPTLQ